MPIIADKQPVQQKPHWHSQGHSVSSIVAPLILFFVFLTAVEIVAKQQQLREQSNARQHLADNANEIRTLLEYELNSTLNLATGLVAYIQSKHGKLSAAELDPWLTNLQERGQHIRNIGIAPNNKITFIYPLAGNEAALGLYYPDIKEQWPAIQRTILARRPVLAGPVNLRQGGNGLIYRVPVYLNNQDYWGLVNTVLNSDELYDLIAKHAQQLEIQFAIVDLSDNNKVLFGDASTLPDYQLNLRIPGRNWLLIAAKNTPIVTQQINHLRILGWAICVFISFLFHIFLRATAKQNQILLELDASRYRFAQSFNTAPQGIALIKNTGELIDFNQSLCSILGYSHNELAATDFFSIVAPDQLDRLKKMVSGIYALTANSNQYESALLHKAGHAVTVIISLAPTLANNRQSDWIIQIIDISQRISYEQLLQEEATYNQSILNAVKDGIMIIDTKGIIRSFNPAAMTIFDGDREHLLHKHIDQFFYEPETGSLMRHLKYHKDDADINLNLHPEIYGQKMNGLQFPLDILFSSITRKQEKIFIAVVRDISERKRLERLKHEFISTISHELRTPLTSILGALRLLEAGALGTFPEPVQKVIRIADQNGKKLALLVNDLLDMDKLLAGKMQFNLKVQPIYPLVAQAIENITAYADQHNVSVQLDGEDQQIQVNVDEHRLQQILANLLSNAAKFSPKGATVKVQMHDQGKVLRIDVIDQGVGISAEDQKNLFQKFYQVDNSNTRKTSGTGLGLAISKELITAMQGTIGVISELGRGSCFYIELPLVKQKVA